MIPNYHSNQRYSIMALKGILVAQSEAGDTILFSTYAIENSNFPDGILMTSSKKTDEFVKGLQSTLVQIRIQQNYRYFAIRGEDYVYSLDAYELTAIIPNTDSEGSFFDMINFNVPMYFINHVEYWSL